VLPAFLLFFLAVGSVFGVELVFVTPEPPEAVELADCPVVNVRGGRAFAFREVPIGHDPRCDAVRRVIAGSGALQMLGKLWDQAITMAPPPAQAWIVTEKCLPVWVKPAGLAKHGPQFNALVPIRIKRLTGKTDFAPHVLMVSDLKVPRHGEITLDELISAKLLVRMLCHELFHGLHSELARERTLLFALMSQPVAGHDSPTETYSHLAFREGVAEAGELWTARRFPAEFSPLTDSQGLRLPVILFAREVYRHRQKLAERNRYIFSADGRVKDGRLKSGETDLATEGVVASLLYTLLEHGNWENPIRVLFSALSHGAPLTFFECVQQLIKENPGHAGVIQRILLEYTRYTLLSRTAAEKYEAYYLARKAFLVGRLERRDYLNARSAWEEWKKQQWERIQAGKPLFIAAPQPLTISSREGFCLDLNDEDEERLVWHLEAFLPDQNTSEKERMARLYGSRMIQRRRELGCFSSLQDVRNILPQWLFQKLLTGYRRYVRKWEMALGEELTRRRLIK
jgi:hypothetical protein